MNTKCPICGAENYELLIKSKDYLVLKGESNDFSVYFCRDCRNGFSFPFMTNDELSKYYPEDYNCFRRHKGLAGVIQRIKSQNDVRIIKKHLKNSGKEVFEIGSGSGFFLSLLAEKGIKVTGMEPSAAGVKYAKENFGIDLENCFFEDFVSNDKYDMIIAFHVLEHFNDPVSAINKMRTHLKDGGYLYLKIPRLDSWASRLYGKFWHGYDLPRHRVHFSKTGLKDLLKREGFEIVLFKSDYGPLDTIRAIGYFSKFSSSMPVRFFFKVIDLMPQIIKFFAATALEAVMSPFKSGRMSMTARKIN